MCAVKSAMWAWNITNIKMTRTGYISSHALDKRDATLCVLPALMDTSMPKTSHLPVTCTSDHCIYRDHGEMLRTFEVIFAQVCILENESSLPHDEDLNIPKHHAVAWHCRVNSKTTYTLASIVNAWILACAQQLCFNVDREYSCVPAILSPKVTKISNAYSDRYRKGSWSFYRYRPQDLTVWLRIAWLDADN